MLVRTALKRYFDEHVTYITTDYPRVFGHRSANVADFMGSKHIKSVNPDLCRAYIAKRLADGAKTGTIRGELSTIISCAQWGLKAKWLKQEDLPVVVLPAASPEREILATRAQGARLIEEAFKQSWRCGLFVVLGLFTGARPSRIRYLRWDAVDMEKQIIDFTKYAPKNSRKRYVRVRMMIELVPYMERAFAVRGKGAWVLGRTTGLDEQLAEAARLAGFAKGKITPNSLRHLWATWAAEDSVDLYLIARVLGNTLKTVEAKYAHLHPSYQSEATQRRVFRSEDVARAEATGLV